jgi:hypothetical protein
MDADLLPLLKTFLVYLHYLPENTKNIEGIDIVKIPLETEIIEKLRSL